MNASNRTTKAPMKFTEVSQEENYFDSQFTHFTKMGCDPHQIVALYSMLVSSNSQYREIAARFLTSHMGLGDMTDDENVAAHKTNERAAEALVIARSLPETPAKIVARYTPGDAAANRALDEMAPMTARGKGTYAATATATDLSATDASVSGAKPYVVALHGFDLSAVELTPEGDRIVRGANDSRNKPNPWLDGTATGAWADYGFGE